MATTMVHVRIDERVKKEASEALEEMGLSVSDAVRMLLVRVAAEKRLPFEVRVPNAVTRAAVEEAAEIVRRRQARFQSGDELIQSLEETGRP
ncbi:DNA-damage-inducible protein J [Methylomarinovum caldicuralii]|uniref:DNA-damage-inducible protein J n=1 Tax=Methylomarinovum caldicuralii TaxID=438856 RepID=A0AAU9CJJ3_9GAMM|nr:type II toxin-antitoxin system RelB/DinJ family antitoxin [Methylomarinovum caldicuralii]BCX81781.1 DNA-damage-inducible protein J [Methylomarinovum caldicuralii]